MSGFKGPGIIPGYGVPEFVAPAGAVYVRYDETGGEIDRVYVSNGVASALPALQLADGALNQYLFMDSSGTILVDTGSSLQNGTYVSNYTLNSTSYLSGVATAASLANGGIVRLPFKDPATGANDAFSIELYYTPSAINAGGSILNSGLDVPSANGLNIGVAAGGFPFIVLGNDSPAVSGVAMVVGQLTQLVATWAHNGSNYVQSFYQNGVLVSQSTWPTPYKYPADFDLQFGTDHNSPNTSAPGTYQAAAFYNVALSPAQISAHYAAALTGGVPLWSDVQAFKVPGIGIGNAITSGVNTSTTLSNETLAINSFITLETAGEIIGLNFEGAGATITSDGTIGTVNVPGISLSGTNITNLVPGVGVKETVVSGIGTIWNTGVLGIVQSGTTQTGIVTITGSVTASSAGELAWYSGSGTAVVGNVNVTYNAGALTVGVAGTTTGVLVLSGATSGAVTITPKVAAGGWTMTLPATAGTSGYVLTTDGSGNLSWTAPGGGSGITYGGNPVTSIVAGTNVTMSLSGGALTIGSTGGGSSPYITPLIANFTAINVPTGGTSADTSTGLALFCPQTGTVVLQAYKYNTAPGSTFTATAGVNFSYTTGNQQVGIFVGDATGKIVNFDQSATDNGSGYQYFNSATSYSSNPRNVPRQFWPTIFMRIRFDGTNFIMSAGADLNALVPLITVSATTWIGAPTMVGISQMPYGGSPTSVFFHWSLTA